MLMAPPTITIRETHTWPELQQRLRQVPLTGDPTQRPYANAVIETRVITADEVWPLSRYILNAHLDTQHYLHWAFQHEHGIDTLHLEEDQSQIVFQLEGEAENWVLIPPIVEESPLDGKPLLIDGEHRFFLAKELNVPIKVIWISQVPTMYPAVALPIEWSEIKKYDEVPDVSEKREYRFKTLESFPDISQFSSVKISQDNFLYFFFRDYSSVCSSGIRQTGSQ